MVNTRQAATVQQWQSLEAVLAAYAVADLVTSKGPSVITMLGVEPVVGRVCVGPAVMEWCAVQHQQCARVPIAQQWAVRSTV